LFIAIENEYTGPELEDGKVTLNFMKELMELYKNQGKLHRKYAYKVTLASSVSPSFQIILADFARREGLFYEAVVSD
jgi:hypothetical protein